MIKQNIISLDTVDQQSLSMFWKQSDLSRLVIVVSNQIGMDLYQWDTNTKKAGKFFTRANKLQWILDSKLYPLLDIDVRLKKIKNKMKILNFAYPDNKGNIWRRISWDIITFDNEQTKNLQRLPNIIRQFYVDRLNYLRSEEWVERCKSVGIDRETLARLTVPLFTRLDMVVWEDGAFYIVEIEPSPAWIGELAGMRDVFNEIYEIYDWCPPTLDWYAQVLKTFWDKNIVAMPNPSLKWYRPSCKYIYTALEISCSNLTFTLDESEFDVKDDGLYFLWAKVDVLLNYFVPKANIPSQTIGHADYNPLYENIVQLYKDWKLLMYPQPTFGLDDKSFLWEVLQSPELYPNSTELVEFLPKTFVYNGIDDLEGDYLLKRSVSTDEFTDIYDLTKSGLTDDIKERVRGDDISWICQQKITWRRYDITSISSTGDDLRKDSMWARFELQLYFPKEGDALLGDILLTLSKADTIIWSTESWVMVPWFLTQDNNIKS